ncbi:MAG TPA: hypothetical protein VFI02_21070, partial [Armatimonadota bacterium]|nr:hypothetical protein [Armatimonadota bacterium]
GKGSAQLGKGVPDGAQITSIQEVLSHGKALTGKEVTVKGAMTQKCPTAGCWFYVKDDTGDMRVDTAPSGFTISEIPLGKTITVYGKVVMTEGGSEMVALGVKS